MLTVEIIRPERRIFDLASCKGASKIITSWHEWSGKMKRNRDLVKEKYQYASQLGDIVKIIGKAELLAENFNFVSQVNGTSRVRLRSI